jgi:Tfp pilus assembly protein PilZ
MQGYQKKPRWIKVLSILYGLFPVYNIIYTLLLYGIFLPYFVEGIHPISPDVVIQRLPWFYWALFVIPIVAAIGLYRVHEWAWYLLILHIVLLILNGFFALPSFRFQVSPALANVLLLIPLVFLFRKEVRAPYFNPRLRWWQQHPRLRSSIQIRLLHPQFPEPFTTYDISQSGCFVQVDNVDDLEPGTNMRMELKLGDDILIQPEINIVWINKTETKSHPVGFGARFEKISSSEKKKMKQYIKTMLHYEAAELRRPPQD